MEFAQKCQEQRERLVSLAYQPHFTVLINATHLKDADDLLCTLDCLQAQTYPHWKAEVWVPSPWLDSLPAYAHMAFHASPSIPFGEMLQKFSALGSKGESSEWVLAMHGGDVLSPAGLFQFVVEMNARPGAELLYPQECIADLSGVKKQVTLLSKCRDSLPTLLHFNYVGRCFAFHRRLASRVDCTPSASEPHAKMEAYAWLLQARSYTSEFRLVPGYWYYRDRKNSGPLFESDIEATNGALRSLSLAGEAQRVGNQATRIVPAVPASLKKISVVICFRNRAQMTFHALASLLRCKDSVPIEVVLVDNASDASESEWLEKEIQSLDSAPDVRVVPFSEPFNFGRMNNWAVAKHTTGDILLFLNNDVALDASVSLDAWASWAEMPETGTVGICLKFPDGRVQHCGIRASFGGRSHLFRVGNSHRQDGLTELGREVFANTFAACMVKRSVFLAHGGLDSLTMANGFGDLALNLRFRAAGLKNLYLGYFQATHAESSSRGQSYEYWEEVQLERAYSPILYEMVREDLACSFLPLAETDMASWVADTLKAQVRSIKWLDPAKPTLKRWFHRLWPSQAHLPI
jgi:O-antigen biosynthesis protein